MTCDFWAEKEERKIVGVETVQIQWFADDVVGRIGWCVFPGNRGAIDGVPSEAGDHDR